MTSTSPTLVGSLNELYSHIPPNHPAESIRVKARDPVYVNLNSFLTVIKVLQSIGRNLAISKYVPVSTRKWAVVVCDGLPYSLCHKILKKTYRCKEYHNAIYTQDACLQETFDQHPQHLSARLVVFERNFLQKRFYQLFSQYDEDEDHKGVLDKSQGQVARLAMVYQAMSNAVENLQLASLCKKNDDKRPNDGRRLRRAGDGCLATGLQILAYIICDGIRINCKSSTIIECMLILLASYYVFDLAYPEIYTEFLGFLQQMILLDPYTGKKRFKFDQIGENLLCS